MQNSKKNWFVVSKMTRIWWVLTWALEILKSSTLIGSFCAKYITFDLKKVQRSYFSWHLWMMQNLKKKWLLVWKITWGIWHICTRAIENSQKLGFSWNPFIQSKKCMSFNLKHEEWCKIWRGIDLSFQNWLEEFYEFRPEYWKVSKLCTLMGSFWTKYRGVARNFLGGGSKSTKILATMVDRRIKF